VQAEYRPHVEALHCVERGSPQAQGLHVARSLRLRRVHAGDGGGNLAGLGDGAALVGDAQPRLVLVYLARVARHEQAFRPRNKRHLRVHGTLSFALT
jgi:hypothetical protein